MSTVSSLGETLLIAAFGTGDQAQLAWQQWERDSGWQEHVEFDYYLLLPQVFRNLGNDGLEDALFRRLKGIVRQNWAANTRRLALLKALFEKSRLPPERLLVLPPLSLLSHDRSTVFSNETAAVWLPHKSDLRAVAADLHEGGWRTPERHIPRWSLHGFAASAATLGWQHPQHGKLQLKWSRDRGGAATDWQPRSPGARTSVAAQEVYCLQAEDTVRYLLLAPGLGSGYRRSARAMLYLRQAGHPNGWQALLQLLHSNSSDLLEIARKLAPPEAATARENTTPSQGEPDPGGTGRLPFFRKQRQHLRNFCRDLGDYNGTLQALTALPGYLMGKWELNHPMEILPRLLRGAFSDYRHRSGSSR